MGVDLYTLLSLPRSTDFYFNGVVLGEGRSLFFDKDKDSNMKFQNLPIKERKFITIITLNPFSRLLVHRTHENPFPGAFPAKNQRTKIHTQLTEMDHSRSFNQRK